MNTVNKTAVCKLFGLDRNTWYHILCANYLYSIGILVCKNLLRNHYSKNKSINVYWMWFFNFYAKNNLIGVDMPLKSIH